MKFCPACGTRLSAWGPFPVVCSECSEEHYENPVPVVGALVPIIDRKHRRVGLPIGTRKIEPMIGRECLPAGFLETKDETWQHGLVREALEELCLVLSALQLIRHFATESISNGKRLIVFGITESLILDELSEFVENDEVSSRRIIWEPTELCFPVHTAMVHRFFDTEAARLWHEFDR